MCYSLNNIYNRKSKRSYPLRPVCSGFQVHPSPRSGGCFCNSEQLPGSGIFWYVVTLSCYILPSLGWLCLPLMFALYLWLLRHLTSTYSPTALTVILRFDLGSLNIHHKLHFPEFNTSEGGNRYWQWFSVNVFRLICSSQGALLILNPAPLEC